MGLVFCLAPIFVGTVFCGQFGNSLVTETKPTLVQPKDFVPCTGVLPVSFAPNWCQQKWAAVCASCGLGYKCLTGVLGSFRDAFMGLASFNTD